MRLPLSRPAAALIAAIVLLTALAAPAAAVDGGAYVTLANERRASIGLAPVSLSAAVDQITVERAAHMAQADTFSHDLPYVSRRLSELGVCVTGYGEIIASERGYATYDPARTMSQWWASQGHRDIIAGNYDAAGGSHATSSVSGKLYSVMVFVKLCAGSTSSVAIERLAGHDRYATAAAISRTRFGGGAATVFIATGASFPDALAGSPAAASANGPILLTTRDALPSATATELARLRPSTIVILGGPGAVSDGVAGQLGAYAGSVQRWSGPDRYETAATISRSTFGPGVAVAYIATGSGFPDALSGGGLAGRNGGPILLVAAGGVPAGTAAELARLRPAQIVILGGTGVVSDAVAAALQPYATSGSVTRLAGADRYATSVAVSRAGYGSAGSDAVFVATGQNFPDGLAGGPVAALLPGPLLLVSSSRLPPSVADELRRLDPERIYVLGGTGSISDGVVGSIRATLP